MDNVWKISSVAGLQNASTVHTQTEMRTIATDTQFEKNFITIGYSWLNDLSGRTIDNIQTEHMNVIKDGKIDWKQPCKKLSTIDIRTINYFRNYNDDGMGAGDIVLLYDRGYITVGMISKRNYYYVEDGNEKDYFKKYGKTGDRAPHRRDVIWLSKKDEFYDREFCRPVFTIYRVENIERKAKNKKLINFVLDKLRSSEQRIKELVEPEIGDTQANNDHRTFDEDTEQDKKEFDEGYERQTVQTKRERNPKARTAAIEKYGMRCNVCGFDFAKRYGELGKEYIEVHHKKPIKDLLPGEKTKLEDLTVVCSNCHRMLHQKDPPIDVDKLKSIVNKYVTLS